MTTRKPLAVRRLPRLAAVRPLPKEETTPPVTKMCLVMPPELSAFILSTTGFDPISWGDLSGGASEGDQLTGMFEAARGVRQARQQPGHFGGPLVAQQLAHAAGGHRAVAVLDHAQMVVGERGHLGQVGHDNDLRRFGEPGESPPDLDGGGPAD